MSAVPEFVLDALQRALIANLENPQLSADHIATVGGISRRAPSLLSAQYKLATHLFRTSPYHRLRPQERMAEAQTLSVCLLPPRQ
jgi:hypothetical protein